MKRFFIAIPAIMAVYPSIFLYFNNKDAVKISIISFLAAILAVAGIVYITTLLLGFFIKNYYKAIIFLVVIVIFIFYYDLFFQIIELRHRQAIPIWGLIFLSFMAILFFLRTNFEKVNKFIGLFSVCLFVLLFSNVIISGFKQDLSSQIVRANFNDSVEVKNSVLGYLPDVYYIIPDGYSNSKTLYDFFNYDNSEFILHLQNKGLDTVDDSKSNYSSTLYSMPSALNMEYGESLTQDYLLPPSYLSRRDLLENSRVAGLFKDLGYKYISISTDNTTFSGQYSDKKFGPSLIFRILIKPTVFDPFCQRFRKRILNGFDFFATASQIAGPKFIVAHILSPHDPYVFGPNGESIGINYGEKHSEEDALLYLGQLQFINKKIEETVDIILKNSAKPPIIIIQSDHGFWLPDFYGMQTIKEERFKNFSAYFLPNSETDLPISNVNTFRFIFDKYFGTNYGQLENKSVWVGEIN